MRKQIHQKLLFLVFGLICLALFGALSKTAEAAGPNLINFQGKVVNADGTNVSNGSYNFDFVMYDDSSLGSPSDGVHDKWHELTKSVTVTNGVFQTQLGSATALPDFNANPSLYLAIKFNGDAAGYMSPRIQMSSVPYALNSDKLSGLTSGNFVQLAQGLQADSSTTNPSIFINKSNVSGTPNILELQKSGVDVFKVDNNGLVTAVQGLTLTGTTSINGSGTASTTIGNSSGGTITIGASSGSDLVLNDANWSVTGAGNAVFAQVSSPTVTTASNGNLTLNPNGTGSVIAKAGGSATSNTFQVQDSAGLTIDNVNTNATANLVANPSFEGSINGWAAKGSATVSYDNTAANAQFGNATLKMVNTAANDGAKYSVPLKASTTYSVTFYAKTSSGSTTAILGRQENGSDVETSCVSFSVTTTWTQFSCANFTTGATINGTSNIYIRQTVAGTPTIYIDGVTLAQSATGLTFDAGGRNFNIQSLNSNITINNNNSGDLQPWQLSANALTANREDGASVTSNGFIYNIAGFDGTNRQNSVMYANMNADGSTGAWSTTTAITNNSVAQNRQYPAAAVANGYVYVVGGFDGTQANSSIFYSKLNSDGTLGTWYCQGAVSAAGCGATGLPANGNGLPAARVGSAAVVSNGFIYVIGGCSDNAATCATPVNTVYYAKLQADGSTGPWLTSANTLSQARGMLTAAFENGYIIALGGRNSTGVATVDKAQIASTGDIAASFSTIGMTALPANLQEHSTVIANGYVYAVGGSDGAASPARQTTVYYSRLSGNGSNGIWQTGTNALPAGRSAQSTAIASGYIYALGGCGLTSAGACSTNQTSTVYYTSTARMLLSGTLDLVGLTSQSIADYGGGGALTAGNGRFIGDLKVDGYADFNNGLSVDSGLNLNAVSSTAGQTVFNINNLNSNSIFSVRHMSTNFGSLATAGAFVQKNSYFGEEFNAGHNIACTTPSTAGNGVNGYARGDNGNAGTATTCTAAGVANIAGGELNFSHVLGAAAGSCAGATVANAPNGVERITATSTVTASSKAICVENLAGTATTANKIYTATNLPVMTMKVKPQTLLASSNNAFIVAGMSTRDKANDDINNLPNTGIFFTNCSGYTAGTGVATGCSNTTWYGMASSAGNLVGSVQTCTGAMSSSQFAYLRIEVRGTSDVHFFVDVDTSNGISETECGSGITSAVSTSAMTPWLEASFLAATANTTVLDVDYFRSWQDDNVPPPDNNDATTGTPPVAKELDTMPSLTPAAASQDNLSSFFDFNAATSEDTTFNHDVYVRGTLFADKIKANQIEGLEVLTDKISSLQDHLAGEKSGTGTVQASSGSTAGLDTAGQVSFNNVQAVNLVVLAQIESKGGLVVDKDAQFNGKTLFQLLAEFNGGANFNGDVNFAKQPAFNSDAGGTAVIKKGAQKVEIKFSQPYGQTPLVIANLAIDTDDADAQAKLFDADYKYIVTKTTAKGFFIYLNKPATDDVKLNWLATSVKDAKMSESIPVSP